MLEQSIEIEITLVEICSHLADRTVFGRRVDRNIFVPQVPQRWAIFASIERGFVAT